MARVHGIHEITLRPGVSGEEFERFFTEEVLPAPQPAGTRLHLWKGNRGERAGHYALIIELDSVATRDRYFPMPGNMSEEAQRVYGEQQALFEKWGTLGTLPEEEGTVYTDYVTIGEQTAVSILLSELVQQLKDRLHVTTVRVTGNPERPSSRVFLRFGGAGIRFHVLALERFDVDVIVTGECPEWETFSYVHDANELGIERALIAVGHQPSEEPGMARLAVWLRERFSEVAVMHVPTANPVAFY